MHRVVVHTGSIVAANATLLDGTVVPSGSLAVGSPATIKEGKAKPEYIERGVQAYAHRARTYPGLLRRIG
jgi:carbonic anhydrase/acetyltransferase-like protein (isoleucine patch superfamily)